MKKDDKSIWYVLLLCCAVMAWPLYMMVVQPQPIQSPKKLVIERVMELQEDVGCKLIDGEIGPETTRLVNAQCIKDANEYYNKLAAQYFTPSGAPRKESQGQKNKSNQNRR